MKTKYFNLLKVFGLALVFLISTAETLFSQTDEKLERILSKAENYYELNNLDSAKIFFKQAIKINDDSYRAQLGLGKVYVKLEKWGDAKDHFQKVLEIQPDNLEALYYLGICYRETGKFKALILRRLDWNKADKYFRQCFAGDSMFEDVFYQYALLKRYDEKYTQAIQMGQLQIELKPDLTEPQVQVFKFYRYCISHENEAQIIDWLAQQSWDQARWAIGERFRRSGQWERADSCFQILSMQPLHMSKQPILLSLAKVYYAKNEQEKAERYYWDAVDSIKNKVDAGLIFEDLKFILKDSELKEYLSLKSSAAQIDFFHVFWTKRDPTPAANINYRLAEHYSRLLYAEKYYEYDGFRTWFNSPDQMGYFDFDEVYKLNTEFNDMGLIYIRQGKADEWAKTGGEHVPFNESWLYYKTQLTPQMTFHFTTQNSVGFWRLTPFFEEPEILEDLLAWDNIYFRMLRANKLERLAVIDEMANLSKESVKAGISSDRHTWQEKLEPLEIPFSTATFRGENGKTIFEIDYAISLAPLVEIKKQQNQLVKKGITLHDKSWRQIAKQQDEQLLPLSTGNFTVDFYRFEVAPDSYRVSFYAEPESCNFLGGWKFTELVEGYSGKKLAVSDIQLAYRISAAQQENKFNKNGLLVLPNPTNTYSIEKPIYVYFEIYNLPQNSRGRTEFKIVYSLTFLKGADKKLSNLFGILGSPGKASITTEIEREGESEISIEYLAIDVSKVKKGEHQLKIKITDSNSSQVAEKFVNLKLN